MASALKPLICRLCLHDKDLVQLFPESLKRSYQVMLRFCTGLNIHNLDNMPQTVCKICKQVIEVFMLFRFQTETADEKLRAYYKLLDEPISDCDIVVKLPTPGVIKAEAKVRLEEFYRKNDGIPKILEEQISLMNEIQKEQNSEAEQKIEEPLRVKTEPVSPEFDEYENDIKDDLLTDTKIQIQVENNIRHQDIATLNNPHECKIEYKDDMDIKTLDIFKGLEVACGSKASFNNTKYSKLLLETRQDRRRSRIIKETGRSIETVEKDVPQSIKVEVISDDEDQDLNELRNMELLLKENELYKVQKKTEYMNACAGLIQGNFKRNYYSKQTLKCIVCEKKFQSWDLFAEHAHVHLKFEINCMFCKINCKTPRKLVNHLKTWHSHVCRFCHFNAKTQSHLKKHISVQHKSGGALVCDHCNVPYYTRKKFLEHWKCLHKDKCLICGLSLTSSEMNSHKCPRHLYYCNICMRLYVKASDLCDHYVCEHKMTILKEMLPTVSYNPTDSPIPNYLYDFPKYANRLK